MKKTTLQFWKMEGCGNSFVVAADMEAAIDDSAALGRAVSDVHFGVGSDGLMLIRPCRSGQADFDVCMVNPDGSPMGMCGNGIRCVSRFVHKRKMVAAQTKELRFLVEGRLIECSLLENDRVRVNLGSPSFDPRVVPLDRESPLLNSEIGVEGFEGCASAVSVGNPHCVIFVERVDEIPLTELGPRLEHHPLFPRRTNVEFVQVLSPTQIKVRVWERGAGVTLACGTGACASVIAGCRIGKCNATSQVDLPGGSLVVAWDQKCNQVFLEGGTRVIAVGELSDEFWREVR